MNFLSLFSGIGGIDLGLERAGMRCVGQVEIDPYGRRVLAKHWPNVPRFEDVRTVKAEDFTETIDLIAGGFPCKQTSTAAAVHGKRSGLSGPDSGLWFEMLRIVGEVRPRWVLVENVSGAGSWRSEIEGGLAKFSYRTSVVRITASAFGAPHLRRRMFFIANADISRLSFTRQSESFPAECFAWRTSDRNPWMSSLPGVLRVDDGIPARVDRRKRIVALGNAVVPQIAHWIGERIMEAA